jgi:hypothetical protein
VAPPVFKTGLAANIVAGGFDSLPPPPLRSANFTMNSLAAIVLLVVLLVLAFLWLYSD